MKTLQGGGLKCVAISATCCLGACINEHSEMPIQYNAMFTGQEEIARESLAGCWPKPVAFSVRVSADGPERMEVPWNIALYAGERELPLSSVEPNNYYPRLPGELFGFNTEPLEFSDAVYTAKISYRDGFEPSFRDDWPMERAYCGDTQEEVELNASQRLTFEISKKPRVTRVEMHAFQEDGWKSLRGVLIHVYGANAAPYFPAVSYAIIHSPDTPCAASVTELSSQTAIPTFSSTCSFSVDACGVERMTIDWVGDLSFRSCTPDCDVRIRIKGPFATIQSDPIDPSPFVLDGEDWVMDVQKEHAVYSRDSCYPGPYRWYRGIDVPPNG